MVGQGNEVWDESFPLFGLEDREINGLRNGIREPHFSAILSHREGWVLSRIYLIEHIDPVTGSGSSSRRWC